MSGLFILVVDKWNEGGFTSFLSQVADERKSWAVFGNFLTDRIRQLDDTYRRLNIRMRSGDAIFGECGYLGDMPVVFVDTVKKAGNPLI